MRWVFAALGLFLAVGVIAVAVGRIFGKPGSKLSMQVAVVAHWLGAYILWTFVAGLAAKHGLLRTYDGGWFVPFALVAAWAHYRARLGGNAERGLAVFVGAQLVWLLIVLVRNGLFDVRGPW